MSALQGVIFAVLLVMAFEWLVWLRKLSSWLRERHPEKYDEMGLDDLWPRDLAGWFRGFDNLRPSMAVLRFLTRREDRELRDPDVSRLALFMRWLLYAYILLFSALFFSVLRQGPEVPAVPGEVASTASSASVERRDQAFDLYRAKKWPQAIAALDALIGESDRDAELRYWRGMAQWQLGHTEEALQDLRRVIELDPAHFDAHKGADRILSRQRRWEEVLAMWDRYLSKVPTDAEAYFERGGTHFHKNDLAAAHADAARACALGKAEACSMVERLKGRL